MARLTAILLALSLSLPAPGAAQAAPGGAHGAPGVRLHVGMWTTHLARPGKGLDSNWLLAAGWRGFYGGTFRNSFGDRAFVAGIERSLARSREGRLARGVGYRLGVVTGYDERLISLAGRTPVLPVLQVTGDMALGRTGLEVAWAGKVATMSPFMHVAR